MPIRFTLLTAGAILLLGAGCGYSKPLPPKDAGTDVTVNVGHPGDEDDAGTGPSCLDNDGDGVPGTGDCSAEPFVDCDDASPLNFPGNPEVCDEVDNDCDGAVDEELSLVDHFADGDGDGYGTGAATTSCHEALPDLVTKDGDCNDADPLVHPGAPEACNEKDDDCNGTVDDDIQFQDFYTDGDGDGFGTGAPTNSCDASLPGKVPQAGDCNDADPLVHPGAMELCNGKDDDCEGGTDESFPNQDAACQTGKLGPCAPGTFQCVSGKETCVGTVMATTELCDSMDNDCDGAIDETFTTLGQSCGAGQGVCAASGAYVCSANQTGTECSASPGAPTTAACDSQDNDCDGAIDEEELVTWWNVSTENPTDLDVAPLFFTTSSCNAGQGTSGTDAWQAYYSAMIVGKQLHLQVLDGDGFKLADPINAGPFSNYASPAIAQAGTGMVAGAIYGGTDIDLYYVDAALGQRQITWQGATNAYATVYSNSSATLTSLRIVRGNGGRFVVLWREDSGGTTKIRMARFGFAASGSNWALTGVTAPLDLVTAAAPTLSFGVASSHEEFGDTIPCPQGNARFALAHIVGTTTRTLKLDVFSEDGTSTGTSYTVYSTAASNLTIADPDVAWVSQGGDRWAVIHALSNTTAPAYERIQFWQSAQSGPATALGTDYTGNGAASVGDIRIVSRPNEWLIAGAISATSSGAQVYLGKVGFSGSVLMPLTEVTPATGCAATNCTNGTRKLPRALPNASGPFKGEGAVLFGGASSDVHSGVLGCN